MATTVQDMLAAARAVVAEITPQDAALLQAKGALIVDVRDATEVLVSGKVPGAVAVSRGMLEFRADPGLATHDAGFQKDRTIILYCGSGGRAALAGKMLRDLGFEDVRNLGGYKTWDEAGLPVERA